MDQTNEVMDLATYSRVIKCSTVEELQLAMEEHSLTVHSTREDGFSLLHSFALIGLYDICKYLCSNGARPTITHDDSTVFHSAVKAKVSSEDKMRADILKLFLDKDDIEVDVNQKNKTGWTAIKLAARRSLEKCVEVLLSNGADPDIADNEKFTPLHNAITSMDILKLLLTKCSNVNAQNIKGETPLYIAVDKSSYECVMSLLEHNADPNLGDNEGVTPLFLATKDGNLQLTELLVKAGASVNACGAKQSISPLHWAAHKENDKMALYLIDNGADIMLADKEGRTPISMASPALAEQMIAAAKSINPDINMASTNIETKLSAADKAVAACCGGNVQALTVLLESGISVDHITGESQSTLLHMAAYCGQLPVVAYLLSLEANLMAVDKDQDTVLHFACMKQVSHGMHERTLQLLLNTPAKSLINKPNSKGDTPVMVATRCGFPGRVKLLLKHKADCTIANNKKELPLHRACASSNNIESVMMFAELSRNVNEQDEDGWTPLMFGAKSGSTAVVQYLLQRGAKPNMRQSGGFTALYLAAQEGHVSCCWHLLEGKADPNIVGGPQGLGPLHIAAHHNAAETCKLLLEYGSDPCLKDNDGDTPLDLVGSPELRNYMVYITVQHVYQRISNKNRISLPSHDNDNDTDHVISNEETITNEVTDPFNVVTVSNNDVNNPDVTVTDTGNVAINNSDVTSSNRDVTASNSDVTTSNDDVTASNSDVTVSNSDITVSNRDVTASNSDVTASNSDVTVSSRDVTASNSDVTVSNSDVATSNTNVIVGSIHSSNGDVTISNNTWNEREEEYCSTISNLKRANELQSIKENELLNTITELNNKLKSLQESRLQEVDTIVSERERYRIERDELQRKLSNLASVSDSDSQKRMDASIPCDNKWQPVNHNDIKLESLGWKDFVFPHLATCTGTYCNMEVTVATLECKQAKNTSAIMSELARLSNVRCSHLIQLLAAAVDHEHHMIYLVYENIGINTLSDLIHFHGNRNVTWKDRIHLLWDITVGMNYLHTMDPSIGHYCLCPRVVQVYETAARLRARVGYYGMTQVLGSYGNTAHTSIKIVPYLAPEILQNSSHVKSSEVYSFGMLMYETLTEYVPYSDTGGSNVIALVTKIVSGAKLVFPKLANKYQGHEQGIKEATSIIISCHSNGQERRPSFSDLMSLLKPLL